VSDEKQADNEDDGYPYIPLSRLRELKHHAEMVMVAAINGGFSGSDLWRIYVGLEVNSLLASHWYDKYFEIRSQLEKLKQDAENKEEQPTPTGD